MSSSAPLVSVVIPAFNAELSIRKAVASALAQGFDALEILLIDDGSTDSTAAVCDELALAHSMIVHISVQNGGPSRARNLGANYARGQFIAFLDADDELLPGALNALLSAQAEHEADCVKASYQTYSPTSDSKSHRLRISPGIYRGRERVDHLRSLFMLNIEHCFSWGWLFRTELARRCPFPEDLRYMEDVIFVGEILSHAESVVVVDEPVVRYIDSDTSVTRSAASAVSHALTACDVASRIANSYANAQQWDLRQKVAKRRVDLLGRQISFAVAERSLPYFAFREMIAQFPTMEAFTSVWTAMGRDRYFLTAPLMCAIRSGHHRSAWFTANFLAASWRLFSRLRAIRDNK